MIEHKIPTFQEKETNLKEKKIIQIKTSINQYYIYQTTNFVEL